MRGDNEILTMFLENNRKNIGEIQMSQFIQLETLHKKVPSIFTEGGSQNTSHQYQSISTFKVMEALMKEGFYPTKAYQSGSRIQENAPFKKHMVRFRHIDAKPSFSEVFPELVLINSHDGLSSYRLNAGLYRLVCSNGLVAGNTYDEVRVRHQGDIIGNVIEGTYTIVNTTHRMLEAVESMKSIQLTTDEKIHFAEAAHQLRFDESINPHHLLSARRRQDVNNDLFSVFNVIQENIIKGGVRGYTRNILGQLRRTRSREVKSIDNNMKINQSLWALAEKMAAR